MAREYLLSPIEAVLGNRDYHHSEQLTEPRAGSMNRYRARGSFDRPTMYLTAVRCISPPWPLAKVQITSSIMHHHGEHHAEHTDARTEAPGPLRPDYSGQGAAASQASAMPRHPIDHADHDKHAGHSVAMFRRKFSIPLVLTLPTLVWGHMLQRR